MSDAHAATQREEQTFRVFEGEPHYIDGYTLKPRFPALLAATQFHLAGNGIHSHLPRGSRRFCLRTFLQHCWNPGKWKHLRYHRRSVGHFLPGPWIRSHLLRAPSLPRLRGCHRPQALKRCPYIVGARTVRLRDKRGYWHLQEQPPSCSFGNVAAVVGVSDGVCGRGGRR